MSRESPFGVKDALRALPELAGLDEDQLATLSGFAELLQAAPGSILLSLGSNDPRMLYLVDGELELLAGDGAKHLVRPVEARVVGPVSRLRPSRYRVKALSEVRYMLVQQAQLDALLARLRGGTAQVEARLVVADGSGDLLDDSATHPLMFDVFDDLNHDRVAAPSSPDIAIRIGRSLSRLEDDPRVFADTLAACPVLALKVVRAALATSPPGTRLRGVEDAVRRVGVGASYELVTRCILRESLRTRSDVISRRMRAWWERTIEVAAISHALAGMSERFDPDFASLVGLLHAVAEPVMLGYADRHPDLADAVLLDNLLHDNRAHLGHILLMLWGLPREIVEAATQCNNWLYDHAGGADYTDILLVAQWHALIGTPRHRRIPPIEEIPAFRRLGMHDASPELGLRIVEAGRGAVERAQSALSA